MHVARVRNLGNCLVLTVPVHLLRELGLTKGVPCHVARDAEGRLIYTPLGRDHARAGTLRENPADLDSRASTPTARENRPGATWGARRFDGSGGTTPADRSERPTA